MILIVSPRSACATTKSRPLADTPFDTGELGTRACCVLIRIGIGTFVATMARSAPQAQLMLLFVNPPLIALSGGFTPIEAMPKWSQPFTDLNPIAHFAGLARAVMVRGSELDVVFVQLFALGVIGFGTGWI